MESKERVDLFLSLVKISSDDIKSAITDHLVKGFPERDAATINGVQQQNFNRAIKRLNKVAETVEKIKELDYAHINQQTDVNGE